MSCHLCHSLVCDECDSHAVRTVGNWALCDDCGHLFILDVAHAPMPQRSNPLTAAALLGAGLGITFVLVYALWRAIYQ